MQQVIVDFGEVGLFGGVGLRIYGYGLMLVFGFLCGIYLARWRARRLGESADAVTTLGLLALVAGVVGSRLAFVVEKWESQFAWRDHPLPEVLNITSGGLIYYGGAALAMVVIVGYLGLRRMPIRRYLDIVAPSLMIGLAFGRMGCLLNGCCYGGRCRADFPLAMRFPYASRPLLKFGKAGNIFGGAAATPAFLHHVAVPPEGSGHSTAAGAPSTRAVPEAAVPEWLFRYGPGGEPIVKTPAELTPDQARLAEGLRSQPVQPAQPLGVVNALLIAGVLLAFSRLRSREGQVFALMLILYPITRFVLEVVRGDNLHDVLKLQLTHNQYTSMITIVVGLLMWLVLARLPASAGPPYAERLAAAIARKPGPARRQKGKGR